MFPFSTPSSSPTTLTPVAVTLVDVNAKMVAAWQSVFAGCPEVRIVRGSILALDACAYVTPTNSLGNMDGGLDAVLRSHFGEDIQTRVHEEIARTYGGFMPVGCATCVQTGRTRPRFLISTPTMFGTSENISGTSNVAVACAAALQAVRLQNATEPGSIRSVALPGLGASTGRVPPRLAAQWMYKAYCLFREQELEQFAASRGVTPAGAAGPDPNLN